MKRIAPLVAIAVLASAGLAGPVLAAAPGNDDFASRQVIDSLPFSDATNTSDATTAPPDAEAVAVCGPVPTDASVWYEFTPALDRPFSIDVTASDYAAGIAVVTGGPGSFVFENCGTSVVIDGKAGITYEIMVFDYDGTGNGGNLALSIAPLPEPPSITLTIDPAGGFDSRTGSATVRGTVTCTGEGVVDKTDVAVQMEQQVGRARYAGFGDTAFQCDGSAHAWSIDAASSTGKFAGGKATVYAYANACGEFSCGFAEANRVITLKH